MQAVLLFAVGAAAIVGALLVIILSVRGQMKPAGGIIAVLCAALAIGLCIPASGGMALVSRPSGDPGATVQRFFTSIEQGNYPAACSCLDGYSSLGLETEADSDAGRILLDALRRSYSCDGEGKCLVVDGLTAKQTVSFSHLDISAIRRDAAGRVNAILETMVDSRPYAEIYDESENYRPEFVEEAYLAGISELLSQSESYTVTENIEIQLAYKGGTWLIVPDVQLFSALMGGAV